MEKNKKRIKTELLVHDLKNPIAIIEAGINSLFNDDEKHEPLTEKQTKIYNRTLRNIKIVKGLVNDILEVGRSSEGIINNKRCIISELLMPPIIEIFDLADNSISEKIKVCKDIYSFKKELSDRAIIFDMDEGLWKREVYLDPRKINQIFRNLLSNAMKYKNKFIDIHIDIKKVKEQGENLFLSVKDDGDGIEKIYHQKIFESYFQIEDEREHCARGHGLGLAGILILIEDMGGKMYLESGEGKGARFSVMIPLSKCDRPVAFV
jgi:two-component system, OmpR family, sensor kinase